MEICNYLIVGGNILRRGGCFIFILVGYNFVLNSRELISWMCANFNVYLINQTKFNCPKFWVFLFKVWILFCIDIKENVSKPMLKIIEWTWFSCLSFLCSQYKPSFFWKWNDSALLCERTFLQLLSQSRVLLLFLNLFYIKFVFCYSTFWSIFMY